jgi:hypothetical protein
VRLPSCHGSLKRLIAKRRQGLEIVAARVPRHHICQARMRFVLVAADWAGLRLHQKIQAFSKTKMPAEAGTKEERGDRQ